MEELYNLKLHETYSPKTGLAVIIQRVPNGWNYIYQQGIQFVPFSDEFEPKKGREEKKKSVKSKPIEERKTDFTELVRPYLDRYKKDMLNEFTAYWTEPNQTKAKMKFEMEKTWDLSRRLARWEKTNNQFDKTKKDEQKTKLDSKF